MEWLTKSNTDFNTKLFTLSEFCTLSFFLFAPTHARIFKTNTKACNMFIVEKQQKNRPIHTCIRLFSAQPFHSISFLFFLPLHYLSVFVFSIQYLLFKIFRFILFFSVFDRVCDGIFCSPFYFSPIIEL